MTRKRRANLTEAEIAKAVQMYRDGEKLDYISAIIGVGTSVIQKHAKAAGLSRSQGKRPEPADQKSA